MKISVATTSDELEAAFKFRYSIYVDEMNRPQRYADHAMKRIEDPLDTFGHILVAKDNGRLVGTLRINLLREGDIGEYSQLYGLAALSRDEINSTSITTRLMIAAKYRSGTLAVKLAKAVYEFALENGIDADFIDCNPPLDGLFSRLGHRTIRQINHPEYGDVTVMKLDLRDECHLRTIGSPFVRSLQKLTLTTENITDVNSNK